MKKKRIWAAGFIFCMSLLFLGACEKHSLQTRDKLHVGVTYYDQSDTFMNELIACVRKKMEELGGRDLDITMTVRGASGSQQIQDDLVEEMINGGCDVLCVNLVDRTDPSDIIELARKNNTPIIFFNREPVTEDMFRWDGLYYVGADSEQSGVLQGELVAEAIQNNKKIDRNKDGKIQFVVLEGEPGHQDTIIRTENAVNTLKNKGIELEKLGSGIANWNRAQAQNRTMQLLSQHQGSIELVLANNDDMALGALDAYHKLNYTENALPVFFGIDGTDVGLEAVREGKLSGTVYHDKEGQAAAMAKLAKAVVTGKGMEDIPFENQKYIFLPYTKIISRNL
jgi:methyl-galactoside transport system substrate-binding protein